jgi:hypothetical protein
VRCALAIVCGACGAVEAVPPDAGAPGGDGGFVCPRDGVRGRGRHRLFVQGHGAAPYADGAYPLLHEWQPAGADAELCDDGVFVNDLDGDGVWEPGEEPRPLGPAALVHGEHFLVGEGA